jgi:flagellar biosynthesis/type III secretory pathway chaperone
MNNQPNQLEILDSAMDLADYCIKTLEMALDGEKDADLYGCTMNHVIEHLAKLKIDLVAAGATEDKLMDEEDTEYHLPPHKRTGYAERMYEMADDLRKAQRENGQ